MSVLKIKDGNSWVEIATIKGQDGQDGQDGVGIPSGGTANQILHKKSNTDYDTEWTNPPTIPSGSTSTPQMDGTGSAGSSSDYSRADHVHPTDTSRASATDVTALQTAAEDKVLYLTSVACSATTGNFVSVSNAKITADHVVAECVFANPSAITTYVTWTTANGSLTLNGTCTSATTCNIVLIKKDN